MDSPDVTPEPDKPARGARFAITVGLIAVVAVVVLGYGAIFLYAKVINDSPSEFDGGDLSEALATDTGTEPAATTSTPTEPDDTGGTVDAGDTASTEPGTSAAGTATTWTATEESALGYRVTEVLFGVDTEGVGRTNEVTGSLTIDGQTVEAAEFEVEVASIKSDDGRRDGQFAGRIMSASEFPTATFVLTEPIELGTDPVEGAEVTATATGELTLRGVTNPVTFEVTARLENGKIGVLGSIPVVFADYGIANPSTAGITTEDNGLVEFVLVFEPAT